MEDSADLADLKLIADDVCVDFVNTVERGVRYQHQDWIDSYQAFLLWSKKAGIIDSAEFSELEKQASANRRKASRVLDAAIRLRKLTRGLLAAISSGSE